jgi:hypothetical protein
LDKALLAELAHRFTSGTATDEEKALLHQWFDAADKEEIEQVFLSKQETEDDVRTRMKARLQRAIERNKQGRQQAPRHIGQYVRWVAAAATLVAVSLTGLYFWNAHKSSQMADNKPAVAI